MTMTGGQVMREQVVERYDAAADELERAVAHLRTAARHCREQEILRGCAHAWAAPATSSAPGSRWTTTLSSTPTA